MMKTSHEAASPLLDGTNNNDDDALQNQREGALKLPSTQPKESRLNTYLQEYAKTQLPRIDTDGNLFTTVGKGTASVVNRKIIDDVHAWFKNNNPTFPVHLISDASLRAREHAPMKGNM
jgi:hypothetical protein